MPPIHPHSHYTDFNLPLTDAAAPIDAEPVRLDDVPGLFGRIVTQGDILAAGDGGVFRDQRAERYTGENEQGVDAAINHFQGIQRLGAGRRAFFIVSGGDSTEVVAHLFVIAMGSRVAAGPWGSNLRASGVPGGDDGMLRVIALERARWHPGGMALLGDVLAVPLEGDGTSIVRFLHVSDPINPSAIPVTVPRPDLSKAGAVALGRVPDGRYVCMVWREESTTAPCGRLDVYMSAGPSLFDGFGARTTISFPDFRAKLDRDPRYQTITLLHPEPREVDGDALFYLIGTENRASAAPRENGPNFIDLFSLRLPAQPDGAQHIDIRHVASHELHAPREYCNFDAAAGVHIDIQGATPRLHVYSAFHYRLGRTFRFAEFYGRPAPDVAITDVADGWIELYQHDHFRGRRLTIHGECEPTIDDYSRIFVQDGDFNETVSSVRWQLPVGCTYRLYRDAGFRGTKPNVDFLDLVGSGGVDRITDLSNRKFGDVVSSSRYERLP